MDKREALRKNLENLGNVAVAFSGGVDSTYLLKTAHDVLGDRCIALTAESAFTPQRELAEAKEFCRNEKIRQIVFDPHPLQTEELRGNPRNRCYLCKRAMLSEALRIAEENGISAVAEGTNWDDQGNYRPGMRAVKELGVVSPLLDCGLTKKEIRAFSRELGLTTWDKPSSACLATRFPYGDPLTEKKLQMADRAERVLADLGFSQIRVRVHGDVARIEILPSEFPRILQEKIRAEICGSLKEIGFSYVTLDLQGFRSGSMDRPPAGSADGRS